LYIVNHAILETRRRYLT